MSFAEVSTHQNILDALQKTSLKEDFNRILKKYNLHIADANCYEEIYLVKKIRLPEY